MIRYRNVVYLLIIFLIACDSSTSPEITVENVWSWPVEVMLDDDGSSHSTGVVYLTLVNKGGEADRLIGIKSEIAEVVEVHETKKQGDRMTMQRIAGGLEVPAERQVEFKPVGLHIMLIGLKRSLNPGDRFDLTLEFEKSEALMVESEVRQP